MLSDRRLEKISRFLSKVLRHKPEEIGIKLDNNGWGDVFEIIDKMNMLGFNVDFTTVEETVKMDRNQRFIFSEDKSKIRANQGHSVDVDIELSKQEPPEFLYHGTATRFIDSILLSGIKKQSRNYVHLTVKEKEAELKGKRYGKPVILKVYSGKMFDLGFHFYLSKNGIWLTEEVPVEYFSIIKN